MLFFKKVKRGKGRWSGEGGKRWATLRKQDLSKGLMGVKGFAWLSLGEEYSRETEGGQLPQFVQQYRVSQDVKLSI